jgi:hypothetical protein
LLTSAATPSLKLKRHGVWVPAFAGTTLKMCSPHATSQFVAGTEPWLTLERRIGSVTGKEAFRPNGDSDPYIRDTYGVRAVIIPDSRSPRGYTVRTAFPVNERPGRR